MRRAILPLLTAGLAFASAAESFASREDRELHVDARTLEEGFKAPPACAKPHTWWHWMNGNVTREGLVADLDAMAELGLGGAQIFDAGCNIPPGPLKYASPEWYDTIKFVAEEARKRGLELCLPNCSGWSSSGGPWIPAAKSMKFLQVKEQRVTGPQHLEIDLPKLDNPHGFADDIAVVAVRVPAAELEPVPVLKLTLGTTNAVLVAAAPVTMRNFSFHFGEGGGWTVDGDMTLEASDDGVAFRPVFTTRVPICRRGAIDRTRRYSALKEPVTAKAFRLTVAAWSDSIRLSSFRLENCRRLEGLAEKSFNQRLPISEDTGPAAADQVVRSDDIVILPAKDGSLVWDVPEGTWDILRVGYAANGRKNHPASEKGIGYEVDKLSKDAVAFHMDQYVGKLVRHLGELAGNVPSGLNNILVDSYEVGSQNWTEGLEKEFERRNGYSLLPYLPVFTGRIVTSVEVSERFLWDFRRTVADLFAESYTGGLAAKCHELGLQLSLEPYGNCPSDNLQYGAAVDIPMGEFWSHAQLGDDRIDIGNSRFPAYIAHVWGRRYAATESFTGGPWDGGKWLTTPWTIKRQGDRAYAAGVNRIIYHRFTHQPWVGRNDRLPGMTMGQWGMHLDRTQTWWKYARGFFDYQARCQWMLQEGRVVADFLFWCGEDAPNEGGNREGTTAEENAWLRVPRGFSWDICATDALRQLKVEDGCVVVPGGVRYRALILPPSKTMTAETLSVLEKLAVQGAVLYGTAEPVRTPGLRGYPAKEDGFRARAAAFWRNHVRKGTAGDAAIQLKLRRDVDGEPILRGEKAYTWIHRTDGQADWYFVASPNDAEETVELAFRQTGRVPEIWDAEKGTIAPAEAWRIDNGRTWVKLPFARGGSLFVVFRQSTDALRSDRSEPAVAQTVRAIGVEGPWTLGFTPGWGAPAEMTLEALKSWTEFNEPDITYYSGTATYRKTVRLPGLAAGERLVLDLGEVKNFAEVTVNGKTYPALWRPPYRLDITEAASEKAGEAELVVKVTNLWVNRLIGDDFKPEDCDWEGDAIKRLPDWVKEGKPSPTGRYTFTTWKHWRKTDKPLPSGLLGPVRMIVER